MDVHRYKKIHECWLTQQSCLVLHIKILMGSTQENEAFQKDSCHFVFDMKVVGDRVLLISTFPSLFIARSAFNPFKGDSWNSLV